MRRPNLDPEKTPKVVVRTCNGIEIRDQKVENKRLSRELGFDHPQGSYLRGQDDLLTEPDSPRLARKTYPDDVQEAIDGVIFIAEHLKNEDSCSSVCIFSYGDGGIGFQFDACYFI